MPETTPSQYPQARSQGVRWFLAGIVMLGTFLVANKTIDISGAGLERVYRLLLLLLGLLGVGFVIQGAFKEVAFSRKTGRRGGMAIQLATLSVFVAACGLGCSWREGSPVPGDRLVALLGKHRDDPAVQAAMKTLGPEFSAWDEAETNRNIKPHDARKCVLWQDHHLLMKFDRANVLAELEFNGGVHFRGYDGPLPLGLSANDSQRAVLDKLGSPDGKTKGPEFNEVNWLYKSRHLTVRWEGTLLSSVTALQTGP